MPCCCQHGVALLHVQVVVQLWVAVSGAVLLFAAVSWVYGFLAAESVHAAYEAQGLTRAHAGGSNGSSA
jgi:hypothetical protein